MGDCGRERGCDMELEAWDAVCSLDALYMATVWVAQGLLESALRHEKPSEKW